MKAPYLIQRAHIKSPLTDGSTRLSQAVSFDYMGSSEFEWGALPHSFRRMQQQIPYWTIRLVPSIVEGEAQLRVLSYLNNHEFGDYVTYLQRLRNPGIGDLIHTKERTEFSVEEIKRHEEYRQLQKIRQKKSYLSPLTDFWWDLDNDVMFSFHKIFMNRIEDHVKASLTFMDEVKAGIPANGVK